MAAGMRDGLQEYCGRGFQFGASMVAHPGAPE